MKNKNIILIFLGIIFGIGTFGVVLPYLISSKDTVEVLIGFGLLSVVILCVALLVNLLITKFFKKDEKKDEEK